MRFHPKKKQPEFSVLTSRTSDGNLKRCGPECYEALTTKCTCICGGVNHGVGLRKAMANARFINAGHVSQVNRIRDRMGKKPLKVFIGQEQMRFF